MFFEKDTQNATKQEARKGSTEMKKQTSDAPRTAIGYSRVSTTDQAKNGVSLDSQRAKFDQYCALHGYTPAAFYSDEGISGKSTANRPAFLDAVDHACRDKSVLVVYSLSRFARNTRQTLEISDQLAKCDADLVSLTESLDTTTASGKMIFRLMAVLAEFERDTTSDRTANAMAHLRSINRRTSRNAPYGTRFEKSGFRPNTSPPAPIFITVPNPQEQITIRVAQSIRAPGTTLRDIANALDYLGLRNRAGKKFAPSVIASMFRSADEQQQKSA